MALLTFEEFLPVIFMLIMGLSLLIYVVLDGYDLGVGMLLPLADEQEKDIMIASIGPFWDANEAWIVLSVGVLLIAFPATHGVILTALYIPVTIMLFGLTLPALYIMLGSAWLMMKTEDPLFEKAVGWACVAVENRFPWLKPGFLLLPLQRN